MTKTNKEVVIELWEAFSSRVPEKIEACLSKNAVWVAPPDNATTTFLGQPAGMSGRNKIVHFIIHDFPRVFAQDVKIEFKGVYADGPTVVVEMTLSATLANGRPYKNAYCFVHDVKDGRVIELREFMDTYNGHRMVFGDAAQI